MIALHPIQRRGVALVIVLSILLLMSALLVAFMGRVGTERAASKAVAQSFEAKQAYESAVNLVMSQIREATRNTDGTRAWASQPGAIRVFNNTAADLMVYKLYSSNAMQIAAGSYDPSNAAESGLQSGITTTPEGYVDLNEPVMIPMTSDPTLVEAHYPIFNPYAARNADGTKFAGTPGHGIVKGFVASSVTHPSGKKTKFGTSATQVEVLSLPMRVKWLYQLKDGTMVTMENGVIAGATKTNPPIARFAFWTDDDSSKVNVNTASEYTYWDSPRASCSYEAGNGDASGTVSMGPPSSLALAASQPANHEYQRYPGHPATTCLSPILKWLTPGSTDTAFKEAIYRLTPRLNGGYGSTMAATRVTEFDPDYRPLEKDRLFANLDEYWFRPDRTPLDANGLYKVFRNVGATPQADTIFALGAGISAESLERVRPFLTASSRSPDLTLYGTPRVCIWPINETDSTAGATSKRSAYDDLMAFCSTVAGKTYYFTRSNPWSTTYDFSNASGGRNKALVDNYLRLLAKKKVPGIGKSFEDKYNATAPGGFTAIDQILLAMFDYVRSTNLVDTGRRDATQTGYPLAYTPGYSPTNDYTGNTKPYIGSGQVIPSVRYDSAGNPAIKGYGRFITLSEAGLLFIRDLTPIAGFDDPAPAGTLNVDYIPIRCVLIPETFTPSDGYPALAEGYAFSVTDAKPLSISAPNDPTKFNLEIGSTFLNYVEVDPWRVGYGRFFMPTRSFQNQFVYDGSAPGGSGTTIAKSLKKIAIPAADVYKYYPFFSKRFYLRKPATGPLPTTFKLNEGSLTFEFYPLAVANAQNPGVMPKAATGANNVIQRITVTFPDATMPVPTNTTDINTRFANNRSRSDPDDDIITGDPIRTVESSGIAAKGDLRIIAATTVISSPTSPTAAADKLLYFDKSGTPGQYDNASVRNVHNFRQSWGRPTPGSTYGTLSPGSPGRSDKPAKFPALWQYTKAPGDSNVVGDFDRGLSKFSDGAYINKPDEGNARFNMSDGDVAGGGHLPYFRGGNGYEELGSIFFTPNRLIPSAIMFGSLPTGVYSGRPWETLLFAPPIATGHIGAQDPPDHYLLDYFNMPVVEPFAISEPLSTMGKINLNCRLAPFGYFKDSATGRGYIERTTGLHAVLTGMKQFALVTGASNGLHSESPLKQSDQTRTDIDTFGTVEKVINPELDKRSYFRSASQICELDLLTLSGPGSISGLTTPGILARKTYWANYNMTGDNMRERAYAQIYPRLTTKSNVFTVHIWAQSITKNPASPDVNKFDETVDHVTGEYRGSTTIERYIDQNDDALIKPTPYDAVSKPDSLEPYYRFRVLSSKRFFPQ